MNFLFILRSNNQTYGGSVFAPLIIRDVVTDFYKVRIDTIFFKETNFWKLLLNLKISEPDCKNINNNTNIIALESFSQLLIWLCKNAKSYNLLISHGIWSPIYFFCSLFCIVQKIPYCFHPHGSLDPFDINKKQRRIKYFLGFMVYKFIFDFSSGIIFTSSLESLKSKTFNSRVNRYIATLTSPNEINHEELNSIQISKLKKLYKIGGKQKIILFLSRIDSKKGLDIILQALSQIKREKKSVLLLIAGEGEIKYLNYIKNIIKKLKCNNEVRFLGHITGKTKFEIMQISDLFVLPSLNENFGIAIVEALQNKLPVIITDNVYIHKQIVEYKAGYLCTRDPIDLSNLIMKILFKGHTIELENLLNCFEKNFSKQKCAFDHFEIYSKISRKYEK